MNEPQGMIKTQVLVGVLIAVAAVVGLVAVVLVDTTGEQGSGLSRAYDLDVERLARFDPNLILYEEARPPLATGFECSRAIAVDASGRLYLAGDKVIQVLDRVGVVERLITPLGEPYCLAVTPEGTLYVGLNDHVEVFDAAGQSVSSWESLGEKAVLTSIAVSGNDVFLADAGNEIVWHYAAMGKLIGRIGEKDPDRNVPGLIVPSAYFDVAVGPDGLLRVANPGRTRIELYTFGGDLELAWGQGGLTIEDFCGCCNPANFAMFADGSHVTAEKGIVRVKVYHPDGSFKGVVAGPDQLVKGGATRVFESVEDAKRGGFDVAVDAEGQVYVLDTIENVVRVFESKGV
ncbi:MAG: NHL repeat-containing protein [Sedimentisphaerales bacterium]|nr:NHL repeat-containing protein [Sedimentisphaerales bacterium]